MIVREGTVDVSEGPVVSELGGVPCVLYMVEVRDAESRELLASVRHGVPFQLATPNGSIHLDPGTAQLEGFERVELIRNVASAPPPLAELLRARRLEPARRVIATERRIVAGERIRVKGALVVPLVQGPYRTAPAEDGARFASDGLTLTDARWARKRERLRNVAASAMTLVTCVLMVGRFAKPYLVNEYRGPEDCPPFTAFHSDWEYTDSDDWCGQSKVMRELRRGSHGAHTTTNGGVCSNRYRTYWAPIEH